MTNKLLYTTTAVSVMAAVASIIYSSVSAKSSLTEPVDTTQAVQHANWADNVTITLQGSDNTFRFQSNGIPSHGFAEKYLIPTNPQNQPFANKPAEFFNVVESDSYFTETPIDTRITTKPVYSNSVTQTSLGQIGVALSGAQIFNDYENPDRSVVAKDDQVIHDHVPFLDECNGHTLVDGSNYHYHGIPVCIAETAEQDGEHSIMIGVLQDGFPVYSNQDVGGVIVKSHDLDECSGHFGPTPEFPEGIYHYHLTADEAPYMIDCYHGEVESKLAHPQGGGPNFADIAEQLGVSEEALKNALGDTMPPDFSAAAQALNIDKSDLVNAMPPPPGQ